MLDKILVLISMVALVVFLAVVIGFVAEPDLIIVTTLIVLLAMHDFWISVFKPGAETSKVEDLPLEALPTGVSGKPLPGQTETKEASKSRKKPARKKK
ncbi:MAG: hypothetical protein MPJ78_16690 [Hyphomicrobiaceae bacterium]|nr:hypothetical protein [Hyphomicrobiaceae bacterium]